MKSLGGIILFVLLGFVSCNFDCFQKQTSECVTKYFNDQEVKIEDSFCQVQLAISRCNRDAAVDCKTGFETEATRAYAVLEEACTEGTRLYDEFNSDRSCASQVFTENNECATELNKDLNKPGLDHKDVIEHNRILCRRVDSMKKCTIKKLREVCKSETREVIRIILENAVRLQKKICSTLPAKGKRASEDRNVYSPLLFAV